MHLEKSKSMENCNTDEVYGGKRLKKKLFKILKIRLVIIIFIAIGGYIFMQQPQFGKQPTGERLEKIRNSPNYKNGKFQNLKAVPQSKDIPDIDYLLISHDNYDHLDYDTILKLRSKVNMVITGLGMGAHFEYWGYDKKSIIEKDWNETNTISNDW